MSNSQMSLNEMQVRSLIEEISKASGRVLHSQELGRDASLFRSGLLDSVSAIKLVMKLEALEGFRMDDAQFDIDEIDSIGKILEHF